MSDAMSTGPVTRDRHCRSVRQERERLVGAHAKLRSREPTSRCHPSTTTKSRSLIGRLMVDGRDHHHAQRHEDRRHREVDDEERQEHEDAHLEGGRELAHDERRRGDADRHLLFGLRQRSVRRLVEEGEVALARLAEHERAERGRGALERLARRDLARGVRLVGVARDDGGDRRHREDREKEGDADEHLVRRRLLGADALPHERRGR